MEGLVKFLKSDLGAGALLVVAAAAAMLLANSALADAYSGTLSAPVRLGVLTGSALSAIVGCAWLLLLRNR